MSDQQSAERLVLIRVQTTVRDDGSAGSGLVREQMDRALERVTNPNREGAGILSYTQQARTSTSVDVRALVRLPAEEDPDAFVLGIVKRALDRVTNHLRTDPGLRSFALEIVAAPRP